jgi:hypothetical protein
LFAQWSAARTTFPRLGSRIDLLAQKQPANLWLRASGNVASMEVLQCRSLCVPPW